VTSELKWWQTGIIYQIYPRSYQDSNGDGVGDLNGILQRLDYVASLDVHAVWLSPIYPSPMHDFGYDVADYTGIHAQFGSLDDFDRLLTEAHERGLRLILDLVPNHTSDEHLWFVESRARRDSPKRDWYIWRNPAPDGGPPNNWLSHFGGPAWTFDATTGQYYLHQFVKQQPELNYRNPAVLDAMLDVMRFWLDRGVDGFRVDVISLMLKDDQFRDEPPNPDWDGTDPHKSLLHTYTSNLPGVHGIIRQMRAVLDEYGDRVLIGETYLPNAELVRYYGTNSDECHLPFNFQLINLPWEAAAIRSAVDAYEAALPADAWPNWVLGNHDRQRIASRVGAAQARVAQVLLLTLRGTPTIYYGEEIGMEDVPIPVENAQDPRAVNQPEIAQIVGRDPERTPMQWDGGPNAGFTSGPAEPWLPVSSDYGRRNVVQQEEDATSMLSLYRSLAALRRSEAALHAGSYAAVETQAEDVLAYVRTVADHQRFLVLLNLGPKPRSVDVACVAPSATIAVSTGMARSGDVDLSLVELGPNEGLVLRL
jgi:alpha-glucosidase